MALLESITLTELLGGSALAGILVSSWSKIKVFFSHIWGLVFVTVKLQKSRELHTALLMLIHKEFRKLSFFESDICGTIDYVRPAKRNQLIGWIFSGFSKPIIYRKDYI